MANNEVIGARSKIGLTNELKLMFDMISKIKRELEDSDDNTYYRPSNTGLMNIRRHSIFAGRADAGLDNLLAILKRIQVVSLSLLTVAVSAYSIQAMSNIPSYQDNSRKTTEFTTDNLFPNWRNSNKNHKINAENAYLEYGSLYNSDELRRYAKTVNYEKNINRIENKSSYELMFVLTKETVEVFKPFKKPDDVVRTLTPSEGAMSSDLDLNAAERALMAEMNRKKLGLDGHIQSPLELPGSLRVSYSKSGMPSILY